MKPEPRRERILELLKSEGRVIVEDLAQSLDSSRETIRRDLTELDGKGLLKKIHGGAVLLDSPPPPVREDPFQLRLSENADAKRRIARKAVELFQPGDTLFIDTGTTTLFLAEELGRCAGLTIITNSPSIASLAGKTAKNSVFILGGRYRDDSSENVGALTVEQISKFYATHAILTIGGLSATGIMDYDLEEAEVARAMVSQSASVTVLADSSKIGRRALFQVAPLSELDNLVTETTLSVEIEQLLHEHAIKVFT